MTGAILTAQLARHPAFVLSDVHDLSKDQIRERTMEKFASMVYFVTHESIETFTKRMELVGIADPAFWTRFGVHYGLFLGAVRGGSTPNQLSESIRVQLGRCSDDQC